MQHWRSSMGILSPFVKSAEHFELKILLFLARALASSDGKPCLIPVQRPYINAKAIPAGTRRKNDVVLTSMRCDDVASTSIRRHFGTICPLGYHDIASTLVQHFFRAAGFMGLGFLMFFFNEKQSCTYSVYRNICNT